MEDMRSTGGDRSKKPHRLIPVRMQNVRTDVHIILLRRERPELVAVRRTRVPVKLFQTPLRPTFDRILVRVASEEAMH